ncbi:hypothetical protein QVD17_19456 [Tagetes erecta]|uniref:Uncharacterized protein n=1 Tax=Tagetes erecta TaxID=13708 RepID=A0AAD8KJS9_TARER|nr:hypothetical protein QVD17_19456 [Tagetes erecta]
MSNSRDYNQKSNIPDLNELSTSEDFNQEYYVHGSSQQQPLPSYCERAYMSLFGSTDHGQGHNKNRIMHIQTQTEVTHVSNTFNGNDRDEDDSDGFVGGKGNDEENETAFG